MTKQQQFASKLRLSRLCRGILALGAFKLAALAALVMLPADKLVQTIQPEAGSRSGANPAQLAVAVANGEDPTSTLGGLQAESLADRGQVAHAAEAPTVASVTPPAPKIRPSQSPFSQQPEGEAARPDDVAAVQAPAPRLSPFIPRDSALRKQEELNRREQELLALQQQMQSRLDEMKNLENKIQGMLKQANNMQDDKLRHLIDVYSNMKAKQAADVLATLDERIAVKILAGMRGKQAGEILTYMRAEPAAKLSELLSRTQLPE